MLTLEVCAININTNSPIYKHRPEVTFGPGCVRSMKLSIAKHLKDRHPDLQYIKNFERLVTVLILTLLIH